MFPRIHGAFRAVGKGVTRKAVPVATGIALLFAAGGALAKSVWADLFTFHYEGNPFIYSSDPTLQSRNVTANIVVDVPIGFSGILTTGDFLSETMSVFGTTVALGDGSIGNGIISVVNGDEVTGWNLLLSKGETEISSMGVAGSPANMDFGRVASDYGFGFSGGTWAVSRVAESVPEPATAPLVVPGLVVLAFLGRRLRSVANRLGFGS